MATNVYTDALQRSENAHSRVIKKDPLIDTDKCLYCGDENCDKSHNTGIPKKHEGQLIQSVRNVPEIDWRRNFGDPNDFVQDNFLENLGLTHQFVRENPMVKSTLKNERAHAIGFHVRLSYTPDYEHLGLDIKWKMEAAAQIEDMWERDMEDPVNCWSDAAGIQTFSEQMGTSFLEGQHSGEALNLFREEPNADHRPFSTSMGAFDIARLSTPYNKRSDKNYIAGKRVDNWGRPFRYFISSELPCTYGNRFTTYARSRRKLTWKPITPQNEWGQAQLAHWFDKERAGQHRATSDLVAGLKRGHMLTTLEETVLDSAARDAAFSMWVQSNSPNVGQAFSVNPGLRPGDFVEEVLGASVKSRTDFYADRKLELKAGQGMLAQLMTDEQLMTNAPTSPNDNHVNFGRAMMTALARALGVDPYTFHGDMTNVNFSSLRASFMQTWTNRRYKRDAIFTHMGMPYFAVWLEEKIARGEFVIPGVGRRRRTQLNFFYNNRRALTMCEFNGPGEESIDPIKGYKAQSGAIKDGLQTRDNYYKRYTNTTFRKALALLKAEREALIDADLGMFVGEVQEDGSPPDNGVGNQANDRVQDNETSEA